MGIIGLIRNSHSTTASFDGLVALGNQFRQRKLPVGNFRVGIDQPSHIVYGGSMTKNELTPAEKFDFWANMISLYFVGGVSTVAFMTVFGALGRMTTLAGAFAVILFWPLFAIKYLAIGVWMVLSAGYGLLV